MVRLWRKQGWTLNVFPSADLGRASLVTAALWVSTTLRKLLEGRNKIKGRMGRRGSKIHLERGRVRV